MRRLPKPKLVFGLKWSKTLIRVVVFLIVVSTYYLTYVLWKLVLPSTRIVIVGGSIHQVYTRGRDISCYATRLLVTIIALDSTKVLTRKLSAWQSGKLAVSQFGLVFFFKKLGSFFLLIEPLIFSIITIYFANADRKLKRSLEFRLDRFIKHLISGVQLLVPTIYLSLDKGP